MPVVVPTLAFMADVYRRSTDGGPRSERFAAYVAAAGEGLPVAGYNPMTSKPVLATIEALLAVDAEGRLERAATGPEGVLHLTVAAPGMWTDRLATDVEHRLLLHDPGGVLWWFDEPVTAAGVDAAIAAQLVRFARPGPPATLAEAVEQEGRALVAAGERGRLDDVAADALAVLAGDTTLSTMVAFLWGDPAAEAMGFTPLGLPAGAGLAHATALAGSGM